MLLAPEPWQPAAAYFKCFPLPRPGWAWEFLRRHPDYHAAYDAKDPERAAESGLLLPENPALPADEALVFWRADALPGMLRTLPRTVEVEADAHAFDLWGSPGRKAVALTQAGLVLLVERDGEQFRLSFDDPESLAARMAFDLRIGSAPASLAEMETARAFLAGIIAERSRRRLFDPLAPKLARYLQALDGHLAGASYGELGRALFAGDPLLETAAGRLLVKGRTRHAVQRGLELMNGGYRRLLLPLQS